ncbi:MAG: hypothetical protein ROR55_19865 [Devosia sp.]
MRPLLVDPITGDLIRKTDQVIQYMRSEDWVRALSIAKSFRFGLTADEQVKLRRAHEAHHHRRFYEGLGRDAEQTFRDGVAVLNRMYGHRL